MRNYLKFPGPHLLNVAPWWFVTNLYKAYGFPRNLPGGGVIGIGELGGGWIGSDVVSFFKRNGLPTPSITDCSVDGATNNGNPADPASGEVALDIQIAGSVYSYCTGKPATIRMYWAPNAGNSIAKATEAATADGCDVMSWSWGEDEALTGHGGCEAMEAAATAATAAGMIVTAASGDNDSSDGGDSPANVDNPASCPHVIACGGTRKPHGTGAETVWNDNPGSATGEGTGGGVSTMFPLPDWQSAFQGKYSGRVVPDVAANADPDSGYAIVLGGQLTPVGGTSAVAPLVAGLLAACGTKLGFVNPALWAHPEAFLVAISGSNGYYAQPPNPGPCSGMGRPLGAEFAKLFVKS